MAIGQHATGAGREARARRLVVWASLVTLYLAVRVPLLPVPLERDEGLYGVMGQAVLRGEVPYRDVFEHKPPGVFYLYALGLLVVPPTAVGVHAFLAVWNFATALSVGALAAVTAGRRAAPWAVLVFIVASAAPSVQGFSTTTEMVLLLPLTASVLASVLALGSRGGRRAALVVASGALAAATFWIKQPAVLAAAAGPLAVLAERRHDIRAAALDLLSWAAGAAGVTLVATVPFALLGVWSEFWYWTFTHSWLYGQLPVSSWPLRLAGSLRNVGRDLGFPLLIALAGAVVGLRRGERRAWLVLAFLALSIASAFHSFFFYTHYFALVTPALGVAAGAGMAWILEADRERARVITAVVAVLTLAIPVATRPWYWLRPDPAAVSERTLGAQGFDGAPLVADYLRDRIGPDERIFIYGSEPEIPFMAGRRDVNPFGMVYPLTWTWPREREFQERVWTEIARWRPAYIVLARNPWSLVRSPAIDPFFEEQLTALAERAYRFETALVAEPGGGLRFVPTRPEPRPGEPETRVLFELWRRGTGEGASG